jgi:hypothetical protein
LLKALFERYDVKGGKDFGQWEKEINGCMLVAGLWFVSHHERITYFYIYYSSNGYMNEYETSANIIFIKESK